MTIFKDNILPQHLRALALGVLLAPSFAATGLAIDLPLPGLRPGDGRLVYSIEVTNPGTRSQGWVGTLYDLDGAPMNVPPGDTVMVGFDTYVSVECTMPWVPCGMMRSDMVDWLKTHTTNTDMGSGVWRYDLYVSAEGSRSEGWTGELHLDGDPVAFDDDTSIETPMGRFVGRNERQSLGRTRLVPRVLGRRRLAGYRLSRAAFRISPSLRNRPARTEVVRQASTTLRGQASGRGATTMS